jgi:hypothetical protein
MGVAVAVSLLFLAFAPATAPAQDPVAGRLGGSGPTVPVLFIPGYAAVRPKAGTILSFTLHRGAPPRTLDLSASYALLVRSLKNAGYREGKTFFGAVYDWRMASAPDDGLFDGTLELVTAPAITRGTYEYAINYVGYWLDQAVQANPGLEYVDVVTHSTGGILARAYIQSPAYGGAYVDRHGAPRRLPKIRHLILGASPNEGTIHSWRPWHADFQDVLSGFIPTTEIEGRFTAFSFAYVGAGGALRGPDYTITRPSILKPDKHGQLVPDPVAFFRLYNPMRQSLMPTSDFLVSPGGSVATNVNSDPSLRSDVLLDLNALSTPGNNPWVSRVGIPGGQGGVIATFASGAREKTNFLDLIVPGLINKNPYICSAVGIVQLGNGQGDFLPLLDLLAPNPKVIPVSESLFPRVGDDEPTEQLSGDGNAFFESYLWTFPGDPTVTLVQWGNGPPPSSPPDGGACPAPSTLPDGVAWSHQTDYPVYHDVFFYNPDVRKFVVSTLTGQTPRPEVAITPRELLGLVRFLDGRE